ncbi:Na+/melibiose symporter [Alicyclobacillus macrosporangiidus]|uniref:Na+/melibiose symporter n=1 Tax=Alicyclobacillus macrosporangiidus TaxID=392015 RepID=A0A1I7L6N0_9BACL|nr:Na+/melibiose symporter [Alicyclobacillus macrosporangiidus]
MDDGLFYKHTESYNIPEQEKHVVAVCGVLNRFLGSARPLRSFPGGCRTVLLHLSERQKSIAVHVYAVNLYAFSLNFHTSALLTIVVPAALDRLTGPRHTQVLGQLAAISALVSMLLPLIAGIWSDSVKARGGKRRPFILYGGLLNALGLFGMYDTHHFGLWVISFLLSIVGQGITVAGYQALWSDVVPAESRGLAAGGQGVATLLGNICGLVLSGVLGPVRVVAAMAAAMLAGMLATVLWVREPDTDGIEGGSADGPRQGHHSDTGKGAPSITLSLRPPAANRRDFFSVFWAQAFVTFGMTLLMTFVMYFFQDVLHMHNPTAGTAGVATLALFGAVLSSIYLGRISDRTQRRNLVALSGAPMALAAIGFAFLQSPSWLYAFAVLFGLGYGAFLSTGWALTVDVLPDARSIARDLGIWGIASTLPAVIAPVVGAWLLGRFAQPSHGYQVLFVLAGVSLGLGGLTVLRVGTRTRSPLWGVPLRLLIAVIVATAVLVQCRVRVDGRLPLRRGSTLVISNHLHDLDGMVLPAWLTLAGPWRHPVYYAASQRLFEPGFLALRFPKLKRFLRRVNLGPLFAAVGVRPIENQPLSRPFASYGYQALRAAGNRPLREVFTEQALQSLGLRAEDPLSALWSAAAFDAAQRPASLTALRREVRSQVREAMRTALTEQINGLVKEVETGGTLFLTPEGKYSDDGLLHRFRLAYEPLFRAARQHYIAAISYDPFAYRRRLGVWVRIVPVPPAQDVVQMLRAHRVITVSQVILHVLTTGGHRDTGSGDEEARPTQIPGQPQAHPALVAAGRTPAAGASTGLTRAEVERGVMHFLAQLPESVQAAADLRANPRRAVHRALTSMVRAGVLQEQDGRYTLGACKTNRHFPNVPDIVSFFTNALNETLQAADGGRGSRGDCGRAPDPHDDV